MSSIDMNIEELKAKIIELERQKQEEEVAYRNTMEWNMEQLDKYFVSQETAINEQYKKCLSKLPQECTPSSEEYIKKIQC